MVGRKFMNKYTLKQIYRKEASADNELRFTGNWFIDAGILGFVNLMEEVYGWDLKELQKIVVKIPNEKLLSQFTYAFWYKIIKETTERWLDKDLFKNKDLKRNGIDPQELKKGMKEHVLNEIYQKNEELRVSVTEIEITKNIIVSFNRVVKELLNEKFSEYRIYLKKVFSQNKKTLLDQLRSVGIIGYNDFFTNLSIFNPSSNISGKEENVLTIFEKLIWEGYVRKDKKIKNLPTNILDKSLSPFIYSASDFHNEYYGKPMTLKTLETIAFIKPVVYLLLVPFSFVWISGKNYLFYAPDIKFAYHVNKKLRYYIKNIDSLNNKKIFKITWNAILDTLIEYKSQYSLENMYILEFSGIKNQQIQNVEYIGISKIVSTILLDDKIRESLNKSLPFRKLKEGQYVWSWFLEELIKGNPLYPIVLGHVSLSVKDKDQKISGNTIFYALSTDIALNEVSSIENKYLFTDDFFEKLSGIGNLPQRIKQIVGKLYAISNLVEEIFSNDERNIAPELFSALRKKNKNAFVNIVLKNIIGKKGKEIERMTDYLFKNILNNENLWERYAMAIIVGLLGGYKNG